MEATMEVPFLLTVLTVTMEATLDATMEVSKLSLTSNSVLTLFYHAGFWAMEQPHLQNTVMEEWGEWSECQNGIRVRLSDCGGLQEERCYQGGGDWSDWGDCVNGYQVCELRAF